MCTFFNCVAYKDMDATIRLADHVIFLALDDKDKNTSVQFKVNRMFIQALCRDSGLRIAAERGITKSVYIIPINKISDCWLERYFRHKSKILRDAISPKTLPPICSFRERWGDRKCLGYCAARENCPYSQNLIKEAIDDEFAA